MAILAIYIVLGVLYESFIHAITILSGLPSAVFGTLPIALGCGEGADARQLLGPATVGHASACPLPACGRVLHSFSGSGLGPHPFDTPFDFMGPGTLFC